MLKIQHLTKHYPGTDKGVTDLSLAVAPGDLFAFIGHNGAGKTTTLKAVAGVHDFEKGHILVGDIDIKADAMAAKRQMAYIPDNPDLYEYLTGVQYLNFIADIFGLSAAEREERIAHYGGLLEIVPALGDLISTYSHGMKQKLAILSALIHEPKLLILDEPFVGLDPKAAATVKDLMRQICARGGAVFFSTHVLEVAERLCNKVAIIKDGRLAAVGEMQAVLGNKTLEDLFMEVSGHDA